MAYRDDQMCHLCGAETRLACPACQNPVCRGHTLASRVDGARAGEREAAGRLSRRLGGMEACDQCVERELAASSGPFVVISRLGDPIQSQMVVEALHEEGFDARAIGTQNAALLGAGENIFEQRIEVPEPQAEAASELVSCLMEGPGGFEDSEGDEPDAEDAEDAQGSTETSTSPRRRGIAAGLAFLFPGASHYYLHRPWTGALLSLAFFLGFAVAARGFPLPGAVALMAVPVMDIIGGQVTIAAVNRGEEASALGQIGRGVLLGVLVLALALTTQLF